MTYDEPLIAEGVPLACNLTASEQTARRTEIDDLLDGVTRVRELGDGYALCFPGQDPWPQNVFRFIEGERSCCPFFTFELTLLPNHGPLWLHIRGPQGVKDIIQALIGARRTSLTGDRPPAPLALAKGAGRHATCPH